MEFRIQKYDQVDSTNLLLKRAIDAGESEGLVICARQQTAGYGRQGRTWRSPQGGLYLSVLLRPLDVHQVAPDQVATLTLAAGLSVVRALRSAVTAHGGDAASLVLKWPNDVVVGAWQDDGSLRKVAGISAELHAGAVCLGVGINLHRPSGAMGVLPGGNIPAYVDDLQTLSVDTVQKAVLESLEIVYQQWCTEGFSPFKGEYEALNIVHGVSVTLESPGGQVLERGIAQGIDDQGRLLVQTAEGLRAVTAGEVHLAH